MDEDFDALVAEKAYAAQVFELVEWATSLMIHGHMPAVGGASSSIWSSMQRMATLPSKPTKALSVMCSSWPASQVAMRLSSNCA